jgi:hypothetical protein
MIRRLRCFRTYNKVVQSYCMKYNLCYIIKHDNIAFVVYNCMKLSQKNYTNGVYNTLFKM